MSANAGLTCMRLPSGVDTITVCDVASLVEVDVEVVGGEGEGEGEGMGEGDGEGVGDDAVVYPDEYGA